MSADTDGRLAKLLQRTDSEPPKEVHDRKLREASVALYIVPDPDRMLIIRRAERDGDPWSGQLALPGGRWEQGDQDLLATAMRETEEEVGFRPPNGSAISQLDDLAPRTASLPPVLVRPWLVMLKHPPELRLNSEVAEASWVRFETLNADGILRDASVTTGTRQFSTAGYHLEVGLLWGMTERIVTPVIRRWAMLG